MPVKWLRRRTESTTKRRVIFADYRSQSAVSIRGAEPYNVLRAPPGKGSRPAGETRPKVTK